MKVLISLTLAISIWLPTWVSAENYKCIINGYQSYQDHQCPDETGAKVVEINQTGGKLQEKGLHQPKHPKKKAYYVSGRSEVTFTKPGK